MPILLRELQRKGEGLMRSFARDARRRDTGRAGNGGTALARSVGRTRGLRCLRIQRCQTDRLLSRLRARKGVVAGKRRREGCGEGERRRDVEDVRDWCVCVQDEERTQRQFTASTLCGITALSWGVSTRRSRRVRSTSTEPTCTTSALLGMLALSLVASTRRRVRATSRSTKPP